MYRNFIRRYSHGAKMPECSYTPSTYTGHSYEEIQSIRQNHLMLYNQTFYKKPLLIHEGYKQWLFDHTGRRYLDMFGGIVTVSVGHCHPVVKSALETQISKLWHTTSIYMQPKIHEYAEKLVAKFPGDLKVVYIVNSGSEANDLALLLARLYTGNQEIISLRNGYHGAVGAALSITALNTWRFPINYSSVHHTMNPDVYRGIFGGKNCRDSLCQTLRHCDCKDSECVAAEGYYKEVEEVFKYSLPKRKLAGFIAESIQGVGGVVQYPRHFLKKAYQLVREHGGVCIADEVQTGFGRTGDHFWGFEGHDIIPDIVTMAKGIGNGFPMAAVVTTPQIAESLKSALHFNTFGGNPMASAVGIAVLKVIEEEGLQDNCKKVGNHMISKLSQLRDKYSIVGDVRGKGLMLGIEMVQDKESKAPLPVDQVANIMEDCKDMGLLLGKGGLGGNVFRIKPPMCITEQDVDFAVDVFKTALDNHYGRNQTR